MSAPPPANRPPAPGSASRPPAPTGPSTNNVSVNQSTSSPPPSNRAPPPATGPGSRPAPAASPAAPVAASPAEQSQREPQTSDQRRVTPGHRAATPQDRQPPPPGTPVTTQQQPQPVATPAPPPPPVRQEATPASPPPPVFTPAVQQRGPTAHDDSMTLDRSAFAPVRSQSSVLLPPRRSAAETHPRNAIDYPFGNDVTAELHAELSGINYSFYEEVKELDPPRRRQFDAEMHAIISEALASVAGPQDVWVALLPGTIGAVLLQYNRGARPTLLDAEWTMRLFVAVRLQNRRDAQVAEAFERGMNAKQFAIENIWNHYFHVESSVRVTTATLPVAATVSKDIVNSPPRTRDIAVNEGEGRREVVTTSTTKRSPERHEARERHHRREDRHHRRYEDDSYHTHSSESSRPRRREEGRRHHQQSDDRRRHKDELYDSYDSYSSSEGEHRRRTTTTYTRRSPEYEERQYYREAGSTGNRSRDRRYNEQPYDGTLASYRGRELPRDGRYERSRSRSVYSDTPTATESDYVVRVREVRYR